MPKADSDTNELSNRLHYKALVDNSMSAIFFSKTDGRILEANQTASEMFGYSEGELKQVGRQGIIDLTDPGFQKLYAERKEHGRIKGELIGIKKNGERFPIEVYSSILKDDKGNEFSYTIINDISERKKSEREINLLMNNTDEAFLLFDKELKIISFNRESQELFKEFLQVEIIKGASVLDYVQPEKKEKAANLYRRVLTGTTEKSIRKVSLPDKSQRIFIFQHHPAKDEMNTIIGVFVTAIDITQEKELENNKEELLSQLQQRNAFIETVLQKLPIGLTVNRIDDGKATILNKKFSEIYGWNEEELTDVETFLCKVYPDKEYREKVAARIMADINSRDINRMQWNNISITTQTGEKRIVNAKNIPLYEQNLMISTVMDVTHESLQAAEIKRTKSNLDALINGTIDLIWSVDKDLRIITVNSAYQNMMQTVISRPVKEGDPVIIEEFGEELCVKWKAYYTRALEGEKYTIREELYNTLSEKMEYRMVSFHPMIDGAGNIFGVACYAKDITEDILNLQLIERTQNKLKKVMHSSVYNILHCLRYI